MKATSYHRSPADTTLKSRLGRYSHWLHLALLILPILLLWASPASAALTVVATESFDYPSGSISGRNGGTGWSGAWAKTYAPGGTMIIDTSGFSYTGLTTSGGKTAWGGGGNQISQCERSLPLLDSGVVWIRFLSNLQSGTSGGGTPQLRLENNDVLTGAFGGNGGTYTSKMSILDTSANAAANGSSSTSANLNTLNLVLVKIDHGAVLTQMWVNPNLATFDYDSPPAAQASFAGLAPAFNSINLLTRSPGSFDEITVMRAEANAAPTDITLSASSIPENNAANATVGTLSATDPDTGDSHTFTLVTGTGDTDNASFSISGNSLRLTPSANFESKNSYAVRIRATDSGNLTYDEAFTISITNVNETPTALSLGGDEVTEGAPANTAVGAFSSTDPDSTDSFTYTLVSGTGATHNADFTIVGDELRINATPVFATQDSYSIRVRTTDSGGLYREEAFTITVLAPEMTVTQAGGTVADAGSVSYGAVALGSSSSLTFSIDNLGDADLTSLAVSIDGAHAANFTLTSAPAATVAAGGQTSFTITYTPSAAGTRTAALHISSNDHDEGSYDITLTGKAGPAAAALAFDGANDTLEIPAHADFSTPTFTIEGWVKPGNNMPQWARLWGTENNKADLIVRTGAENRFSFAPLIAGEFTFLYAPTTWTPGQWYHVAGVVDHLMIRLFINGVQVAARPKTSPWLGDSGKRYIGRCTSPTPPNRFSGVIDEVRYWNHARNCDQISQARSGELTGAEPGLVAYYKLNQGVANNENLPVTTVTDSTGNGHHGALSNSSLSEGNSTSNWTLPGAVTTGVLAPSPQYAEIDVLGNGLAILDGDTTPSDSDHTDFGLPSSAVTRTFTIENTGNLDLEVTDITLAGADAGDFVLGGLSLPATIPGGASTTFDLTIEAANFDHRSATVLITSDDCDEAEYEFAIQSAPPIEVTTTGGVITVSDLSDGGGAMTIAEPAPGSISFGNTVRAFSIDGGPPQFGGTGTLSLASVTAISIVGGGAADTFTLAPFTAELPQIIISDGAGANSVTFAGSLTFSSGSSLTMDIAGELTVNADCAVITSGSGAISLTASGGITIADNAALETEDGPLEISANQQAVPHTGDFVGVEVEGGAIRATGSGYVTVKGKGGDASAGWQSGVRVGAGGTITTAGGLLTVEGSGGASTGPGNSGVLIKDSGSAISSTGGDVVITGVEGAGVSGVAIVAQAAISTSAAAGSVTLRGDSMSLDPACTVTAPADGTVALLPHSASVGINLGRTNNPSGGPLCLTDAELDRVSAGALHFGPASGPIVTSAAISRATPTNLRLTTSADIDLAAASLGSGGGSIHFSAGGVFTASGSGLDVHSGAGVTSFAPGSQFASSIGGASPNSGYQQLNLTGSLDLSGASLTLSGAHVPVKGQTFVLINNDDSDPIQGAFTGLAEGDTINFNGVPLSISYTGGSGNDVTLGYAAPNLTVAKAAVSAVEGASVTNSGTLLDLQGGVTLSANIGAAVNHGDGTWSWTHTPADGPATESVTITATDDSTPPLTASVSFSLAVKNAAPVAQSQTLTIAEDAAATPITLTALEPGADTLTYGIVSAPAAGKGALGSLTGNVVNFTPAPGFAGQVSFTFKATDSDGATGNTATVTINVTADNDAPVFLAGPSKVHPAGFNTAQSCPAWASAISDGDADSTQTLAFIVSEVGSSGIFTTPPEISPSGALTYRTNGVTGTATLSVSLTDSAGASSPPQTFTITVASFSPGTYTGLAQPADGVTPTQFNLGLLSGALTSGGSFSGKVNFGGVVTPFVTAFSLATGAASGSKASSLAWSLHLDLLGGTDKITGSVTRLTAGGPTDECEVDADRATFSAANRVPATLLNSANSGAYTLAFASTEQTPPLSPTTYPQGHGFGKITLTAAGGASLTGTLADGASVTFSAPLSKALRWPLAILQRNTTTTGHTLGGIVQFDPTQPDSDLHAPDLQWFRPALANAKTYPSGWPGGINVHAIGALYSASTNLQSTLGLPVGETGGGANAELAISGAGLVTPLVTDSLLVTGNSVTRPAALAGSLTFSVTPTTGAFTGAFTPIWSNPSPTKPIFKGILIQKGTNKGGYGFFLSNARSSSPQSGTVTLAAP